MTGDHVIRLEAGSGTTGGLVPTDAPVRKPWELDPIRPALEEGFGAILRKGSGSEASTVAGAWIIGQISEEAERLGEPLLPGNDPAVLRSSSRHLLEFGEAGMVVLLHTTINCVPLVRSAIERAKQRTSTVRMRQGLRIPKAWQQRYDQIVTDPTFDWVLTAIMQDAFLGCAALGETRPWKSR